MTTVTPPALTRAIEFVEPLPGFEAENAFTLSAIDSDGLLLSLRSVRTPDLRFVLTPAECFFADYRPEFGPAVTQALGDDADGGVELLLMLTIGTGLRDATANMRAPILVSTGSGRAMQVVLDDETLPMRRPLIG
jgi:flagellar assembly factor FliW